MGSLPLHLPTVPRAKFDAKPIDWRKLNGRYINIGELEIMIAMLNLIEPASMIEIGCNEGRTARAVLDNVRSLRHYQGVDVRPGYVPSCPTQRREIPIDPGHFANDDPRFILRLHKRGSLDLMPDNLGKTNAMFIDGDHGREAVIHDTFLADNCVQPGGLIIWHDYHGLGNVDVRECLHKFQNEGRKLFHVEKTWLAFEQK